MITEIAEFTPLYLCCIKCDGVTSRGALFMTERGLNIEDGRGGRKESAGRANDMATLDDVKEILQTHRIGHLATADAAGAPHIVPVCFICDGQAIYSAIDHKPKRLTGYRMKRVRNIVENPQAAFLVHHYDEDWQKLYYILIRGAARILEQGEEYQRALNLLETKYAQYRERRLTENAGLVITIASATVNHWVWHQASR
jgi:PPOX class probable F420-dependent enzyme